MHHCTKSRATTDLPTPPFSPPMKWILLMRRTLHAFMFRVCVVGVSCARPAGFARVPRRCHSLPPSGCPGRIEETKQNAPDGQVREARARAARHGLQALQQRLGQTHLRQRLAASLAAVDRGLEDDRERKPPRPDLAPGPEAAPGAGGEVLLRRRLDRQARRVRPARSKVKPVRRCAWAGDDPLMIAYHDEEWGREVHDDRVLFEFLVLEGAQAGLSWSTVLRKREGYRRAFAGFDVKKVARFGAADVKRLMADAGIVRNRLKLESAVKNARAFRRVQQEFGSFSEYQWRFVDGSPLQGGVRGKQDIVART